MIELPDNGLSKQEKNSSSCGCVPDECCPGTRGPEEGSGDPHPVDPCSCGGTCSCNSLKSDVADETRAQDLPNINQSPVVIPVSGTPDTGDTIDHILARLGQNRSGHRVTPGLYSIGSPGPESPVIVTANYTLSFDAVRSSLAGRDAYILVLDTKGINVWCAAGKGTFGTEELVNRIRNTGLDSVVHHHRIILPQLGAPGIAAHEVHKATGFHVEYGPVRASDLPEFLRDRIATPAMREVTFNVWDRAVLIPVELRSVALYTVIAAIALWFVGGGVACRRFYRCSPRRDGAFPHPSPISPDEGLQYKRTGTGSYRYSPFCGHGIPFHGPGGPVMGRDCNSCYDTLYITCNYRISGT